MRTEKDASAIPILGVAEFTIKSAAIGPKPASAVAIWLAEPRRKYFRTLPDRLEGLINWPNQIKMVQTGLWK
jgi:hypothetical protein